MRSAGSAEAVQMGSGADLQELPGAVVVAVVVALVTAVAPVTPAAVSERPPPVEVEHFAAQVPPERLELPAPELV